MAQPSDTRTLIDQARRGDRHALARLITLVEDGRPGAEEVLARLYKDAGRAWTTGLTGAPGSGKSTLTDRLIEATCSFAGLRAEDTTTVTNAHHIDRGYDGFVPKLEALGARITRE